MRSPNPKDEKELLFILYKMGFLQPNAKYI